MVFLDAALVIGVVFLVVLGTMRLLQRPPAQQRPALGPGQWRAVHYDLKGETRVVLQKVTESGGVADEHVIATIPVDDPEYDAKFVTAMSTARERRSMFELEGED